MVFGYFFFFKQKPAYEMRISDWSSDVCSSDLALSGARDARLSCHDDRSRTDILGQGPPACAGRHRLSLGKRGSIAFHRRNARQAFRSEEHTSELQSLMRISYAVFCLKQKKNTKRNNTSNKHQENKHHKTQKI